MPVAAFLAAATAIVQSLGEPATYLTTEGVSVSLRAALQRDLISPVPGMESLKERRVLITVRAADLAATPAKGDQITVDGHTYFVTSLEADNGYTYVLKVRAERT